MVGAEESAIRARVLACFGRALVFAGRSREGLETAEAAVALARAVGDPESLTVALQALANASERPTEQLAAASELAALAEQLGDPWLASYATANLLRANVALGRLEAAAEALDRQRATNTTARFATFQFMTHAFDAVLALAAADFAGAEAAAVRAEAKGAADEAPYNAGVYGLQMFAIRRAQGRLAEVAPVVRAIAGTADPPPMWRPGVAALYAELGMLAEARTVFAELAVDRFAAVNRDAVWPASLTFLAETCIGLSDTDQAAVLYDELQTFAGHNLMAGMTICFGPADRLRGGLAMLLQRPRDADEHFRAALALAERSSSPLWTAEVQDDWATALATRDASHSEELRRNALTTARVMGIGRITGRHGAGGHDAAERRAPSLPDNLSPREAEVLRLVATGLSNREIGAALFISQNTVANHVRAILQKAACANRAEASAYAVRNGLVAD